jgi:hypothetical protein
MDKLRLICWNAEEAKNHVSALTEAGYQVDYSLVNNNSLRQIWVDPPDAIIIDLSRLPSQGRDLGVTFRRRKATRLVPLIFAGGKEDKVARVKSLLPDATFTEWQSIGDTIASAILHPPENPVIPNSVMAAYAGTPLPKKLGIKPGSKVGLFAAPSDIGNLLGELPEKASLHKEQAAKYDLTLWFVRTLDDLTQNIDKMYPMAGGDGLWILWPKRSTKKTGLSQTVVRKTAMDAGLVDYKIASFDPKWSGLRFTHKK